jgi:inner membrane protein
MRYSTHATAGFMAGFATLYLFEPASQILLLFSVLFGAMFPDLDLLSSKISKQMKHTAEVLSTLFSHRGFMHSFWVPLGILALSFICCRPLLEPSFGFFIGYSIHLMLDALTKQGIRFFYPFRRPFLKGPFRTGGFTDLSLTLVFAAASVLLALPLL